MDDHIAASISSQSSEAKISDEAKKAVADLEILFKTHGLQALQEEVAAIHMRLDRVKADRAAIERRISVLQKNEQLYDILNQPFPRDEAKEAAAYDQLDSLTDYIEKLVSMTDSYEHTAVGLHSAHMANVKESKQRYVKGIVGSIKNRTDMPKGQDKKRETGLRHSTSDKSFGDQPNEIERRSGQDTAESVKSDTESNSN